MKNNGRFVNRESWFVVRELRFTIHGPRSTNTGQMLIIVLWVMGLVSVAVGSLTMRSTHDLRLGVLPLARVQRLGIAQTGLHQALAVLERDDQTADHLEEVWATGDDPELGTQVLGDIAVDGGRFRVGVRDRDGHLVAGLVDEERKLPLNAAPPEALQRLIETIQAQQGGALNQAAPEEIVAGVVDWTDGPEDDPLCAALPYPCRNGPFQTVDELRLVPGMTPPLFEALQGHLTVYGSGVVNANTAGPDVLTALGADSAAIIDARQDAPFTADNPPPGGLGFSSTAFTIPVEAELDRVSGRARIAAVVSRDGCATGAPPEARCILAWLPQR